MYKLFYSPGACSMAVHVALNECGAKFDVVDVSQPGMKDPGSEFLKANPNGAVPTLMDDGLPIREGGAILTYLCDKEKSPLLPRIRAGARHSPVMADVVQRHAASRLRQSVLDDEEAERPAGLAATAFPHVHRRDSGDVGRGRSPSRPVAVSCGGRKSPSAISC
ncbi:MAG: glutathione S-transferase N-terminal domain-containing protein [Alphaproteobacteria bacterium]